MKYFFTKTNSKLTTLAVALQAGSALEEKHGFPLGTAHFLEHFMFKGTKSLSQFELSRRIAFLGGSTNAYTTYDAVVYHMTVPSENLEEAVAVFSDMIKNPLFPEEELEKERQVILEEYYSYKDDVHDVMRETFNQNYYTNYYKNPIIGTKESISSISLSDLRRFHDTFYKPQNMIISFSSSAKKDKVIPMLEKYFYQNDDVFEKILEQEKSFFKKSKTLFVNRKELEQSMVMFAYPTLPLTFKKSTALNLMSMILGGGMDSRLFQEVREKNNLVYSVSSSYHSDSKNGIFSINFSTRHSNIPKSFEVIEAEVKKMVEEFVTEEELQRAKNKIKTGLYSSWEDQSHLAFMKISRFFMRGKIPTLSSIIKKIDSVSIEDVKMVANKTFGNKKITIIAKQENEA